MRARWLQNSRARRITASGRASRLRAARNGSAGASPSHSPSERFVRDSPVAQVSRGVGVPPAPRFVGTRGAVSLVIFVCALGAAPATNPAPAGRFDNIALRAGPSQANANGQKKASSDAGSAIEGLDTRRVALSLAAVISLILVLKFLMRKFFPQPGGRGSSAATRVLSRTMIAPKQQVILLQVGKRIIVVGDCGTQMHPLAEISDPDEVATLVGQIEQDKSSVSVSGKFGGLFHSARKPFEDHDAVDPQPVAASAPVEPLEEPASGDLAGLAEKIRLLSSQFRRGAS